jgi:hypothetical protein
MYDELALVVGKDMATGSFSKGVTDVDGCASNTIDLDNDLEKVSKKKQADSLTQTRSHKKRSHANMIDESIFKICHHSLERLLCNTRGFRKAQIT